MRKKVNNKLLKLETEGVIEDVTEEATPWISPIVVLPEKNEQIRICVDMRSASKVIGRIRYPTPTIKNLMINLKDAATFTKLDLLSALHQLELTPGSRSITTFQSDSCIKRFTRLMSGINSAQEELQYDTF